ncbi:class I SAM-dependent methyltransferase [soil metagenome]
MFKTRSSQLERIDTGDYTPEEYDRFLREISFVNRFAGDSRALQKTLLREIERENLQTFSVLDVGAGSGELLRTIAKFARKQKRKANLFGLELNPVSANAILKESKIYKEIRAVRGDALNLPLADNSFDYAICSLFTHHFTDKKVVQILSEMNRVSRRGTFVIDLHRHRIAYLFYKVFCAVFRISPLVRQDGSLSLLRSFKVRELAKLGRKAQLENVSVERHFPFRLVLKTKL